MCTNSPRLTDGLNGGQSGGRGSILAEREERIGRALEQLPEVAAAAAKKRNGGKAEDAGASTTDPMAPHLIGWCYNSMRNG